MKPLFLLGPVFVFCSLLLFLLSCPARAQAVIDPDMPAGSEPLVKHRVLYFIADYGNVENTGPVPALSTKQKFQLFAGETFDPGIVVIAAALAGFGQGLHLAPDFGQGGKAYAQRAGAITANLATSTFFSEALMPTIFHQDPRYFRKGTGTARSRIWWAIRQTFVTRQDSGESAFNYSEFGSLVAATAMTNLYYPSTNRKFGQEAQRFAIGIGVSAGLNVLREFAPLHRREKRRH